MATRCRFALLLVLLVFGTPPALGQQIQGDQDTTFVETKQQEPTPKFGGPSTTSNTKTRSGKIMGSTMESVICLSTKGLIPARVQSTLPMGWSACMPAGSW
jgi:hypothetical protein